jgi:hypothetical protein
LWSGEFTLSFGCLTVFWGSVFHCEQVFCIKSRLVFLHKFILHHLRKSSIGAVLQQLKFGLSSVSHYGAAKLHAFFWFLKNLSGIHRVISRGGANVELHFAHFSLSFSA